jgi:hypothetical protein
MWRWGRGELTLMETPLGSNELHRAAKSLAFRYGKNFGVLAATGMAAIEIGLEWAGVGPGDQVVVPSLCCYLVPAAVRRIGAVPVFGPVDDRLTLDPHRIDQVFTERTRAVIAVHHLGLPCPIAAIRSKTPSHIPIIEDAAQAFDLHSEGAPIGSESDVVVTSFGQGKPLSFGGGGGVFGSHASLESAMDRYGVTAREGTRLPHSSALHPRALEGWEAQVVAAQQRVLERRQTIGRIMPILESAGLRPWHGRIGDRPTWHRLPVWPRDSAARAASLRSTAAPKVIQQPHKKSVFQLEHFKEHGVAPLFPPGMEPLLIRLDDIEHLQKWLNNIVSDGGD